MALTLEQLNAADTATAVQLLDGLYEHSPWIAEAAMAQGDPTNYTALGEQQAKIDEAHAAMDELEMAWLEASEKLEGEE